MNAEPTLVVSEVFGPTVQGEGPTLGRRAAFLRLGRCNLSCKWCFAPDTPILMADWTWRPIGLVEPGDRVIGRTLPENARHGRLVATTVLATGRRVGPLVDVGAFRCTPDHQVWLAGDRHHHSGWRAVEQAGGARVTFLAAPTKREERLWGLGWLAGMADGDGCFWSLRTGGKRPYRRFRLALKDSELLDRFRSLAGAADFNLRTGTHAASGFGIDCTLPCLWLTVDSDARAFEQLLGETPDEVDWAWGYIGGMLDAEGSLSGGAFRISQSPTANERTFERIRQALDRLELRYVIEPMGFRLAVSQGALFEVLTRANPVKGMIRSWGFERAPNNYRVLVQPEACGEGEVVSLATSVGSYVAAGFVVRNCDTPYTWDWERFDPKVELAERPVDEIVAEVEAMDVDRVVVTGGEPLLQQRRLLPFLEAAAERGWAVEVETNGTLAPSEDSVRLVSQFNVSPKLANSGVPAADAIVPGALATLLATGNAVFKFVVTEPAELDEVQAIVDAHGLSPVWIMPEGTTAEAVLAGGRALADAVTERGWHLTTRLHVLLWGDERGR